MSYPNSPYYAGASNQPPHGLITHPYPQSAYPYSAAPLPVGQPQQPVQNPQYVLPYMLPPPGQQYPQPGLSTPSTPTATPIPQPTNSPGIAAPTQVYILTPSTLLVAPGQSVPGIPPYYPALAPTAYKHNGLPVYGPVEDHPQKHVASSAPKPAEQIIAKPVAKPIAKTVEKPKPIPKPIVPVVEKPHVPRVFFHMIRNAQESASGQDPGITESGVKQCENLKNTFPYINEITGILCSPLKRAVRTTARTFGHMDHGAVAWPELRDCSDSFTVFNKGQKAKNFASICSGLKVNTDFLKYQWEKDAWEVTHGKERAESTRKQLHQLAEVSLKGGKWHSLNIDPFKPTEKNKDVHIVIVSHNNFLHKLTHRDTLPKSDRTIPDFAWVQFRSYQFAPAWAVEQKKAEKFMLYETADSKARKHIKDAAPPPNPVAGPNTKPAAPKTTK